MIIGIVLGSVSLPLFIFQRIPQYCMPNIVLYVPHNNECLTLKAMHAARV